MEDLQNPCKKNPIAIKGDGEMNKLWDDYWKEKKPLNADDAVKLDSNYLLLKRLIDLPLRGQIKVLEVGCGSGIRTLALIKDFRDLSFSATLVDYSFNALAYAQRNGEINEIYPNIVLADAFDLPFKDGTFDIVWNSGVNEHFEGEKRQNIFNEMARVCKNEGEVIVIIPNAWNLPYRLWKKSLEIQGKWQYGFEKPFSVFELKKRMIDSGLIVKKASGMNIIVSIYHLMVTPSRIKKRNSNGMKRKSYRERCKLIQNVENFCERKLWFVGENIGLKGMKR